MKIYASRTGLDRAIIVDDDSIIAAAGLRNVLCCEPEGLIETEELFETTKKEFEWTEATMQGVKEISGMSIKQLSDRFDIPYRTIQNWINGTRTCPPYIPNMMLEILV